LQLHLPELLQLPVRWVDAKRLLAGRADEQSAVPSEAAEQSCAERGEQELPEQRPQVLQPQL
jgi:hypothetical protein